MGYIRLLLAILVLASHSRFAPPFTGALAVECFFVISGFYMQMILLENYSRQPQWIRKFWQSRLFRIFIPYWAVMAAIMLIQLCYFIYRPDKPVPLWPLLVAQPISYESLLMLFSNLFILGTETIKLLRITEGCGYGLWTHILIPPVWSVGIELMFYAIAPFLLLRRLRVLVMITASTVIAKTTLYAGQSQAIFRELPCADGLLNGMFPLEIGVFLAGAIGYRFYRRYLTALPTLSSSLWYLILTGLVTILSLLACLGLQYNPMISYQFYLCLMIVLIPLVFTASRMKTHDRAIGEISYPFYLSHFFVLWVVEKWGAPTFITFILALVLTGLSAWLVTRYIELPLNQYRHNRYRPPSPAGLPA